MAFTQERGEIGHFRISLKPLPQSESLGFRAEPGSWRNEASFGRKVKIHMNSEYFLGRFSDRWF